MDLKDWKPIRNMDRDKTVAGGRPRLATLKPRLARSAAAQGWSKPERGTRQQRGYGAVWMRLRTLILKRDHYLCRTCLRQDRIVAAHTVDHIVPKAEGGSDDPANLEAICVECHTVKTQAESNRSRGGG